MKRFFLVCAGITFGLALVACGDSVSETDSNASASSDPDSGQHGDDFHFCNGFYWDCDGSKVCVVHSGCDEVATSAKCETPSGCDIDDYDCWTAMFCEDGFALVEGTVKAKFTVNCSPLMCEAGTDSGETDSGETDSGETDSGETDSGETDTGTAGP